jgi:hypothetical protein
MENATDAFEKPTIFGPTTVDPILEWEGMDLAS